jgi:hypothetical protein
MKIMRFILTLLLALLVFGMWLTIIHQSVQLESRRIPEERLIELLDQSHLNERRLGALAAQNSSLAAQNTSLTSRTQAILERITSATQPAPSLTPYCGPDEPLVLYEVEPVKATARKGKRK